VYSSSYDVIRGTLQTRGPIGLYRGLPPWLFFAFPRRAIRFGTFEATTAYLCDGRGKKPSASVALVSGCVAGAWESALGQCPCQNLQIKQLHDANREGGPRYRGFVHAAWRISVEHGIARGLFAGLAPTVLKGATNNAIRFSVFGELKHNAQQRRKKQHKDEQLSVPETLTCGAVAGGISAVVTHPIDTVKANMQGLAAGHYTSSIDCLKKLAQDHPLTLYRGIGPRLVRVCLESALHFSLYDICFEWFNKAMCVP